MFLLTGFPYECLSCTKIDQGPRLHERSICSFVSGGMLYTQTISGVHFTAVCACISLGALQKILCYRCFLLMANKSLYCPCWISLKLYQMTTEFKMLNISINDVTSLTHQDEHKHQRRQNATVMKQRIGVRTWRCSLAPYDFDSCLT